MSKNIIIKFKYLLRQVHSLADLEKQQTSTNGGPITSPLKTVATITTIYRIEGFKGPLIDTLPLCRETLVFKVAFILRLFSARLVTVTGKFLLPIFVDLLSRSIWAIGNFQSQ